MKAYRPSITVLASKIEYVGPLTLRTADGEGVSLSELGSFGKDTPKVGDYFVIYQDGHKSFAPKAQFDRAMVAIKQENE